MVEIVSGNQLGLVNSSASLLGNAGGVGSPQLGKNGDQVYLNAATGNLVIESLDDYLAATGANLSLIRTYNSQGLMNDANGDNWRLSVDRRVYGLTGTVNTAGSTITKQFGDGTEVVYTYNATLGLYVAKDGSSANDTLGYNTTSQQWTWTNGASQAREVYNATGQMLQSVDINGNATTYTYTGAYLTSIADASGQTTYLDYTGNNLSDIRVVSGGVTQTRTRYTYDGSNRLSTVVVDLSPADNAIADGNTYTTTYTYDGTSNRVASITSGDGTKVSFTYTLLNGAYRVATYTDGNGNVSTLAYSTPSTVTNATPVDLLAHASALSATVPPYYTVPSGATWASVVLAVYGSTDAAAATALQTALGNPALTLGAHLNVPVMFTYTPVATAKTVYDLTTVTSPLGFVTTLKADASGRLVALQSPTVGTGPLETDYAYDANGNVATITDDPAGRRLVTTIQYDANGNVVLRRDGAGNTVTSTYSSTNQLLTQTTYTVPDPAGTGVTAANGPRTTRYAYDARGNLRFIASAQGRVTEYRYDAAGRRVTQIEYQGTTIDLSALTLSTAATEAQMITWAVAQAQAQVAVQRTDFAYDFRGNVTSSTSYAATAATGGVTTASSLAGADVGTTGIAGSSSLAGSTVTVKGGGADVGGTVDAFQFDSAAFTGDGSITARVVSQTNTNALAKAGVMIRESTAAGAQYVFMELTPTSGALLQSRVGTNSAAVSVTGPAIAAPYWVRVTRAGNTFTGFVSVDGVTWTQVGETVVPMASTVLAGLAVSSHVAGTLSTATFDSVTIAGGAAAAPAGAAVTQYVYDQRGLLLQTIDPRGLGTSGPVQYLTTYTYDGLGRPLSTVRWTAAGNVTSSTDVYTGATKTATVTLANGTVATTTYDAAGNILSVAKTNGATALGTTTYAYDTNGELRRVTDPLGNATDYIYDAAGRKAFVVDGAGQLTQFIYDQSSNLVETIRFAGLANKALLSDVNGKPLGAVNTASLIASAETNSAADLVTRNIYDSANRLAYAIDSAGDLTGYSYDGTNQLVAAVGYATPVTIARAVGVIAYTPGAINGTTIVTNANDRLSRRFFDTDGKLLGALDAAGYLTQNFYDAAGNLQKTVAYATATATANRASGTLAQLVPALDAVNDQTTWFFYDGIGRQVGVLDAQNLLTQNVYDAASNLLQVVRYPNAVTYTGTPTLAGVLPGTTAGAHITQYTYDELNHVVSQTNFEGTVTTFQYDTVGNLITKTLAVSTTDAQIYQTQYDALGRIAATLSPVGAALITVGMTPAQIQAIWTQYGTTYSYDLGGNLLAQTDPAANTTHFYYDADGRQRYSINALGEVVETRYNALGQVSDRIAYVGRVATTGLTGGLVTTAVTTLVTGIANAANDSHVTYTYAANGRVATQATAEGGRVTYTYDAFGDVGTSVTAITSTTNQTVQNTYDARGQLTQSAADPTGINAITKRSYDAFGRVASATDPNGNVTSFSYDRLGRTIQVTDPLSGLHKSTYDAFSRTLTTVDARNQTTTYQYNDTTLSVVVTTPQGVAVTTTHTRNGQTATITNALGTVTYVYDAAGHLTRKYDATGNLEVDTYDAAGRIATVTDADGVVTQIAYDAASRVFTRTLDPTGLNLVTTYTYDGEGRTVKTQDAKGAVTTTAYDRDGRTLTVTTDPTGLNLRTTYSYDLRGDVLVATVGAGSANPQTTTYTYDALGRRTQQSVALGLSQGNALTQYFYDAASNLTRRIDANNYSTWYVYDAGNRETFVVDALGGVTQNVYDASGHITSTRRYATAIATTGFGNTVTLAQIGSPATSAIDRIDQRVYDNDGRLVYQINPAMGVTQLVYDGVNNVVERIAYANAIPAGTYTTVASVAAAVVASSTADHVVRNVYDSRGELRFTIDALGNVSQTVYDGVGNIVKATAYATTSAIAGIPTLATLTSWATTNASSADRTTQTWYDTIGRQVLVVDSAGYATRTVYNDTAHTKQTIRFVTKPTIAAGATTAQAIAALVTSAQDQSTTDTFDLAGRLVTEADGLGHTQQWQYDAVGNKTQYTNQNGAVWTYVYDGNRRLSEEHSPVVAVTAITNSGSALTAAAPISVSLVTHMTYDALGNVLSRTEAFGRPEARTTSYQYDALGRQILTVFPAAPVYNAAGDTTPFAATVSRTESSVTPQASVTYNTLGDAVMSTDVAGNVSRIAYDQLGRIAYEVDALNYVTAHGYDSFGNETSLTRYSATLNTTGLGAGVPWTTAQVVAGIVATAGADRTTTKGYDQLNRLVQVTQPSVFNYLPTAGTSPGGTSALASAVTLYDYNAFGNVVRTRQLADPTSSTYAATYFYFDTRGLQIAAVDPGGYLTAQSYDSRGNLLSKTEYATALTTLPTTPTAAPPAAPASTANDRVHQYTYDALNRELTATLVGLSASTISGTTVTTAATNQTTTYGYDGVGNVVSQTDTQGHVTYTYYDALGRVTAVAQPTENTGAGTLTPLVSMGRDAFGNMTSQTQYAGGAASVSATAWTAAAAPAPTSIVTFSWTVAGSTAGTSATFGYRVAGTGTFVYATPVINGSTFTVTLPTVPNGTYDFTYSTVQRVRKAGTTTTSAATGQFSVSGSTGTLLSQTITAGAPTGVGVTAVSNPTQNHVTLIQYDAYGHALATQDANGYVRNASYDVRGNIAKQWQNVTNANDGSTQSIVTVNTYDALNRLVTVTTPETASASQVAVTKSVYNAFGEIVQKGTYANGTSNPTLQENYSYDQAGRLWRSNAGDGVYKIYEYNLLGNATATITSQNTDLSAVASAQAALALPAGNQMRQETLYDLLGRAVQQRSATFGAATTLEQITGGFQFGVLSVPVPPNAIYQAISARAGKGGTYTYYVINPTTWANNGGYYQVSAPTAANPQGTYARVAQTSYQLVQHGCIWWNIPTTQGITANFSYSGPSSGTLAVSQLSASQQGVDISALPSGTYTYTLTYTRATDSTAFAEGTGTFTVTNGTATSLVTSAVPPPAANVSFSWNDIATATIGDFTYYASGTTNYVSAATSHSGTSFRAALGSVAPGTYNFTFNTYRSGGKAGLYTLSTVTGTFTVANGAVTLGTVTIALGAPTNIAVSGNIAPVATPVVTSVASGGGAVVSWAATNTGATAKVEISQGAGAWTTYAATLTGSTFSATIPTLAPGSYNFRVTETANGEIVALGSGTLTDSASTTAVSGVTPTASTTQVATVTGTETSSPGNPDVTLVWSSPSNGTSADLYYGPSSTYVTPTLTGTTTVPGVTTVTGVTQNTATNPLYVAPLSGSVTTNFGNPTVGFTWASTGTAGDFYYKLSTATTYTYLVPTVSNGVFNASIGSLPAGTYNVQWDAYRVTRKGGNVTTAAGTATITVANGVATLTSSTITTGTPTGIAVTGTPGGGTTTTSIQWNRPTDTAVVSSFGYRVHGSTGAYTTVSATVGSSAFSVALTNLAAGTYDFQVINSKAGTALDTSTGTFTLTSTAISFAGQTHSAPASFATVSFSGSNLSWTQATTAGDTITVTVVNTSGVATTLTATGSGSSWSASVNPLGLAGTYTYTINYTKSGATSPYLQATGSFTTTATAAVTYNNWSAHIGIIPAGTYSFSFDTTRTNAKAGTITTLAGTGTFTANANGTAALNSETVTTGSLLSMSASGVPSVTTYTTTIQWARPTDTTVYASLGYRVHGSTGAYTTVTPAAGASNFVATLANLPFGTYDYTASDFKDRSGGKGGTITTTLDTSTGTFTVTATGVTFSAQTHTTPASITTVGSSGSQLTWTQAANAGDTVTVTVTSSTAVVTTLTAVASGANYTASLAGLASGAYSYAIKYTASGGTTPYLQGTGSLTVSTVPITVTASATTGVAGVSAFLDGGNNVLYWTNAASAGSTVTFYYRQAGATTWAGTLTPTAYGTGFSVNVSALSGTIEYEVVYTASGQTTPYLVANGVATIVRTPTSSGSTTDTTATTLAPVSVTPSIYQTYDRWGDVLTVKDASGNVTTYGYNQLGGMTQVTLPASSAVTTTAGTIATVASVAATQQNYFDSLGRLVGKRDGNGNLNTETFNENGLELSETHADGGSKQFVYDGFGHQIQITEAATATTSYRTRMAYDADGQMVEMAREITAGGFATANAADLSATGSTGTVEYRYVYDAAGRRVSATNGQIGSAGTLGTIKYWYDQQGHVLKSVTPLGSIETYAYDLRGNKTQDVNPINATQSWTYDYFGNVLSSTDLGGMITTFTHNQYYASQLTAQTSTIGGVAAQNITYGYDAAGHLLTVHDRGTAAGGLLAVSRDTTFAYDAAGRQSRAAVVVDGLTHSDTQIAYDQLNRVSQLSDLSYRVNYSYDLAGNRTLIQSKYFDYGGTLQTQSLYYTYDAMNRVLISQGANVSGSVGVNTAQGIRLTYDYKGDRLSAYQYGQVMQDLTATNSWSYVSGYNTQNYTYDGIGDLLTTNSTLLTNGTASQVTTDSRTYDKAQRVTTEMTYQIDTSASPAAPVTRYAYSTYDADGRTATQLTYNNGVAESFVIYGQSTNTTTTSQTVTNPFTGGTVTVAWSGAWTPGYDAAGNLRGYIEEVFTSAGALAYSSTDTISYRAGASYQETGESIASSSGGPLPGATQYTYNVDGQLASFVDTRDLTKNRYFADDSSGHALTVVQGDFDGTSGRLTATQAFAQALSNTGGYNTTKSQHFFFALGQQIGSFGQLTSNGTFAANFDVNYTPVSQSYPANVPAQVVAEQGDTLKTIAARIYGDPNLWYVIAQENGLTDPNVALTAGTVLRIPNSVVSLSNTANAYKPYNAALAIGKTSPTQPIPPPQQSSSGGGGCGILGEILIIIVTVIVTIVTEGATVNFLAAELGSQTAGAIAAGAIAGAAGSIAGQAVGIATGLQSGFNWDAVALGAIGGGVGAGVNAVAGGANGLFSGLGQYGQAAAIAVTDSVITQGIGVALGLQKSFNWGAVAAAGIAAPLTVAADNQLSKLNLSKQAGALVGDVVNGATSALVNVALGGKFDTVSVLANAFGQFLGNSLNDAIKIEATAPAAATGSGSDQGAPTAVAPPPPAPENLDNNPPSIENLEITLPPIDLPSIELPELPPPTVTVGEQGSRGFWGVAQSILGPDASNADIRNMVLQLMSANPGVTTLHSGDSLQLGDGSISQDAQQTYNSMDTKYQADLQARRDAQAATVDFMAAMNANSGASYSLAPTPSDAGNWVTDGRAGADSYWGSVQDDAAASGSPIKYMAASGMKALADFGYGLLGMGDAAVHDPGSAAIGAGKSLLNLGPDVFNMGVNTLKTSLDGLSLLSEASGLASSGTFDGFRSTSPYNVPELAPYSNQAEQGGGLIGSLATGKLLAEFGTLRIAGGATATGSLEEATVLQARAQELNGLRDPWAAENGTTAVANVQNVKTGEVQTWIATNGNKAMPAEWDGLFGNGETFVQGPGHAEQTIVNALGDEWAITSGGSSRNICIATCQPLLEGQGLQLGGPTFRGMADKTPYRMFWNQP